MERSRSQLSKSEGISEKKILGQSYENFSAGGKLTGRKRGGHAARHPLPPTHGTPMRTAAATYGPGYPSPGGKVAPMPGFSPRVKGRWG